MMPTESGDEEPTPVVVNNIGRMDFITWDFLDAEGFQRTALSLDPRRYSMFEKEGQRFYLDRYLRNVFSEEVFLTAVAQTGQLPAYSFSPSIVSASSYARSRRSSIASEIDTGKFVAPSERTHPSRTLKPSDGVQDLAFISVDVCSSSSGRYRDKAAFGKAFEILLKELGTTVGFFGGSILKTTGDGFIAYIDHPSFNIRCDNTIDLGLSLLRVMSDAVSPALTNAGLAKLDIRIGADHGPAEMQAHVIPTIGFHAEEVASDALNRAVKIERSAPANEFRIGRALYELIHVGWLERSESTSFDGATIGIPGYQVYRVI